MTRVVLSCEIGTTVGTCLIKLKQSCKRTTVPLFVKAAKQFIDMRLRLPED